MSTGIWSAASGAVAQTTALDVASNNIANASTPGFRADRAVFRRELNQAQGAAMGTRSLKYSLVRTVEPDRRQGQIVQTGKPLDVALKDPDQWFRVSTPQGMRYTRVGSMQLGADGTLRTPEGFTYLDNDGSALRVRPDAQSAAVGPHGILSVDGIETAQRVSVVRFANPAALVKDGSVLMRAPPNAGKPQSVEVDLETAAVESSNASALSGMTSLVQASREFEMVARVIDAFSDMEHRTAQEVGRGK
ncbi:MAG TPA: flagellar hook-basal body protein [Polyangiaceae bacterium]